MVLLFTGMASEDYFSFFSVILLYFQIQSYARSEACVQADKIKDLSDNCMYRYVLNKIVYRNCTEYQLTYLAQDKDLLSPHVMQTMLLTTD